MRSVRYCALVVGAFLWSARPSGAEIVFKLADGGYSTSPDGSDEGDYLTAEECYGGPCFFERRDGGWATIWAPDGQTSRIAPVVHLADGGWAYEKPNADGGRLRVPISEPPTYVELADGGWLYDQRLPDGGRVSHPVWKPADYSFPRASTGDARGEQ